MMECHAVPVNDLIEHEASEDCICGPHPWFVTGGIVYTHHALDAREALEPKRLP